MRALLRHIPVVAFTTAVLVLSACGQRGPLYLPDEAPTEVKQSPPPATPAPETTSSPETTPAPEPAATPAPDDSKDTERKPDEKPR